MSGNPIACACAKWTLVESAPLITETTLRVQICQPGAWGFACLASDGLLMSTRESIGSHCHESFTQNRIFADICQPSRKAPQRELLPSENAQAEGHLSSVIANSKSMLGIHHHSTAFAPSTRLLLEQSRLSAYKPLLDRILAKRAGRAPIARHCTPKTAE